MDPLPPAIIGLIQLLSYLSFDTKWCQFDNLDRIIQKMRSAEKCTFHTQRIYTRIIEYIVLLGIF